MHPVTATKVLPARWQMPKCAPVTDYQAWLRVGLAILIAAGVSYALPAAEVQSPPTYRDFDAPPHNYSARTPKDRFSRTLQTLESDPRLNRSGEKAFLLSFLKILGVPASSQ